MQQGAVFRQVGTNQNVTWATSGGASAASSAFGSQTYWIRVCAVSGTAGDGVRYVVGDGTPTAVSTSALLPVGVYEYVQCSPGQKVAVLGNGGTTGSLNIVELTH